MKKIIATLIISALAIVGIFTYSKEETVFVEVVSPRYATVYSSVIAMGNIEQSDQSYIAINTNGSVESLNFKVYDEVSKGDVVMTIRKSQSISDISVQAMSMLVNSQNAVILDTYDQDLIEVVSNVDGKILSISSSVGEAIVSGVPFLSIASSGNLVARVEIYERHITKVSEGQQVSITGDALLEAYTGQVLEIIPYVKTSIDLLGTGSESKIEAIVSVFDIDPNTIIGSSIEASIITDKKENALVLPYEVIFQEDYKEYVYIAKDGIAVKTEIITGYELDSEVEVTKGISYGDIVIENTQIDEGVKVSYEK